MDSSSVMKSSSETREYELVVKVFKSRKTLFQLVFEINHNEIGYIEYPLRGTHLFREEIGKYLQKHQIEDIAIYFSKLMTELLNKDNDKLEAAKRPISIRDTFRIPVVTISDSDGRQKKKFV